MNLLTHFPGEGGKKGCDAREMTAALWHKQKRLWKRSKRHHCPAPMSPKFTLVIREQCPICPTLSAYRPFGPKPFMSWQPTPLPRQSFSMYPSSETDFQWPRSVGYCYPFRGKFPVQGSIMIPINVDMIHAAKIHMPPAKTFPCRGRSSYLFRHRLFR